METGQGVGTGAETGQAVGTGAGHGGDITCVLQTQFSIFCFNSFRDSTVFQSV